MPRIDRIKALALLALVAGPALAEAPALRAPDLAIEEGGVVIYRGVGHVGEAPAVAYDALPAEDQAPVEPNQTHADVGLFEQMSPDRARLLQPAPVLESRFDILYLTR